MRRPGGVCYCYNTLHPFLALHRETLLLGRLLRFDGEGGSVASAPKSVNTIV